MSYIAPLKGRPRIACETLHALGGQASGGDIGRAAGFPDTCTTNVMVRLITAGCARVVGDTRPRIYALTPDWRDCMEGLRRGSLDSGLRARREQQVRPLTPEQESALDDPAHDVPPDGFRTSIPAAPWVELAGAWR